jgi:hypothetical protein
MVQLIACNRQRRFRDRKESYTKQLEKKISELEETSASLQLKLAKLSEATSLAGGPRAENLPPYCPKCGLENRGNLVTSAQAQSSSHK